MDQKKRRKRVPRSKKFVRPRKREDPGAEESVPCIDEEEQRAEQPLVMLSDSKESSSDKEIPNPAASTSTSKSLNQPPPPDQSVIELLLAKVKPTLPADWTAICDTEALHLLMLSTTEFKVIQREIVISFTGLTKIALHGVQVPESLSTELFSACGPPVALSCHSMDEFVHRSVELRLAYRKFKVCVGANHLDSESIWNTVTGTIVDLNFFQEFSYTKCCRSLDCHKLVPVDAKNIRCAPCNKVIKNLKKRFTFAQKEEVSLSTRNDFLTLDQAQTKLKVQHEDIRKQSKRIAFLEGKIFNILDSDGVDLDDDTSSDLNEVFSNANNLTEIQKLFLQQQLAASSRADGRGHRWHPVMIRLALHIKMVSGAAYEALQDSGIIKLPSSRNLFNYSNFVAAEEGVNTGLLQLLEKQVMDLKLPYQKYHSLLVDEMHISQNLVYRKEDGSLVGYAHLDQVDKELAEFERSVLVEQTQVEPSGPTLAKTMLAFMVKGICSGVQCVVASYPCAKLNRDILYARSWTVISHLEMAGIKVLTYVADGNHVNRAFFDLHTPITKTDSGVVYDTINYCAPDRRPMYFISDVCHLLKTVRNCFYNSGEDKKKPRCFILNGEKIVWSTIVRLYMANRQSTFRKSYKLNPQNVFPNSFSCMKVKYAAEVLSNTVASDLEKMNWPGTSETVKFLRFFNRFFDCFNGAFSSLAAASNNPDLAPYTSVDDERFNFMDELLDYLAEWKRQANALDLPANEREKTIISWQTLQGIEISIRAIRTVTKVLLNPPNEAKFIMTRTFSQDPLERHFSYQRSGCGGSTNPNAIQFMKKQVSLAVQRQLGVKRRGANVEDESERLDQLGQRLPRLQQKRTKAFSFL